MRPTTLTPVKNWTTPNNEFAPSQLALQIMAYRRAYGSAGIYNFVKEYLDPTLHGILTSLRTRGFTVAVKVVNSEKGINYCIDVSKNSEISNVLYVAHYDTVDLKGGVTRRYDPNLKVYVTSYTPENEPLTKQIKVEDGIAQLDYEFTDPLEPQCLGADDGAGLAVMLHLLNEGVLGGYCFTTGEECGGVGAEDILTQAPAFLKQYDISVEIDRRGTSEIIYCQSSGDTASKTFAQWLCDKLDMGHKPSDNGSYTDNSTFAELIPENVNIAAGYVNAHTMDEKVLLPYLDSLAEKLKQVVWADAPIEREAGDYNKTHFVYNIPTYNIGTGYRSGSELSVEDLEMLQRAIAEDIGLLEYMLEYTYSNEKSVVEAILSEYYGDSVGA